MTENKETPQAVAEQGLMVFSSEKNFELAQRMSRVFNTASIVPVAYQGDKGMANCMIALEMANRMGASPLMVMQNLNVIHGNPTFSAKFLIACINTCGKFKTPLRYEFRGEEGKDDWACRAYAIDNYGEKLFGSWVSLAMAKKEGWVAKNGSKWITMPELMLQYRAAAFFQRVYAPEISMGMYTSEEVIDMGIKAQKPEDTDFEEINVDDAPEVEAPVEPAQHTPEPQQEQPTEEAASDDDF
jgi:hypothetical protein